MKDFRDLKVWEKAHALTLKIYQVSKNFPAEEKYGLTSQIRRAVASIPTNIAEGCGQNTDAQFSRYLVIAFGSASETAYLTLLAGDLEYIKPVDQIKISDDIMEIKRMLSSLISKTSESI